MKACESIRITGFAGITYQKPIVIFILAGACFAIAFFYQFCEELQQKILKENGEYVANEVWSASCITRLVFVANCVWTLRRGQSQL